MTNEQIAKSLVNMGRGGYRPNEVIPLIIQGIEMSECRTKTHIKVEYDLNFFGGNYYRVGMSMLIKVDDIAKLGSVEAAFKNETGYDPVHIIHYSEDYLYNAEGKLIEG